MEVSHHIHFWACCTPDRKIIWPKKNACYTSSSNRTQTEGKSYIPRQVAMCTYQVPIKRTNTTCQHGTQLHFPLVHWTHLKSGDKAAKWLHRTAAQLAVHIFTTRIQNYVMTVDRRRMINVRRAKFCHKPQTSRLSPYQTLLGRAVSFQSLCALPQRGSSSTGSGCIPPRAAADWIFCSAAQIPLNWNFQMEAFQIRSRSAYHMKACDVTCPGLGLGLAWGIEASPQGPAEDLHSPTFICRKCLFLTHNHSWNDATWRRGYKMSKKGKKSSWELGVETLNSK